MATDSHEAPEPADTLSDRFRDAIAPRTLLLGIGVLLLQFAFILSYIGAFHSRRRTGFLSSWWRRHRWRAKSSTSSTR